MHTTQTTPIETDAQARREAEALDREQRRQNLAESLRRTGKVYRGFRGTTGCIVTVQPDGGHKRHLRMRLDLAKHSPTGFEWGYFGSGPAQLALAILADHLGDDVAAVRMYQLFKEAVVAKLPRRGWVLTSYQIDDLVSRLSLEA